MLRCLILARLTASARIARAPMATAPAALAPIAKAPRLVHPSPVAPRANATCLPKGGCSSCLALRFLIVLSLPRFAFSGSNHHPGMMPRNESSGSAQEPALRRMVGSVHRASERGCSRKPDFRQIQFSEIQESTEVLEKKEGQSY